MKKRFCHIPESILLDDSLTCAEKIFLGMVHGFSVDKKGEASGKACIMGNIGIGRIVKLSAPKVSKMIARVKSLGLIAIDNEQSKHRRIYFALQDKVEGDSTLPSSESTLPKNDSTLPKTAPYFALQGKHNLNKVNDNQSNRTKGESHGRSSILDGTGIYPAKPETENPADEFPEPIPAAIAKTDSGGFPYRETES